MGFKGVAVTASSGAAGPVLGIAGSTVALVDENVNTVAASTGALTLPDVTVATLHRVTLTANCTLAFPAAGAGKSFLLELAQDGTGSRTAAWPASVKWAGGTAPTLTATAGKGDLFSFYCLDGANWLGAIVAQNY